MPTPTAARRGKSKATRAAEQTANDRAKLSVVPDPPADPEPAPPVKPDPLTKLSKALGQPAPRPTAVPDVPPAVVQRAAAAAKATPSPAAAGSKPRAAAAPSQPKTATRPVTPRVPKVKAPKVSGPANAKATYKTVDRYNAVVTADGKAHLCEHAARNSHITLGAALTCGGRLLRNYEGGVVSTEVRSRYWGVYQANAAGSEPVSCGCRFGHRATESAVACAQRQAAQAGLVASA